MNLNLNLKLKRQLHEEGQSRSSRSCPIGVFDSGVGGLTVVAALQRYLPHENIIYLGDTARVPYGGKSQETVTRYSKEIADLLFEQEAKILVVACNTASALAVSDLQKIYKIPIQGVIEPGAAAAIQATRHGKIGVMGTKATIASNAYTHAIQELQSHFQVTSLACPLLVPLIEEGLFEDEITEAILRRYLAPMLAEEIDALVLGCTHYPLLKKMIARIAGPEVALVDSAENCALAVQSLLTEHHLATNNTALGQLQVMLTDTSESFLHLAAGALDLEINKVTIVKLH